MAPRAIDCLDVVANYVSLVALTQTINHTMMISYILYTYLPRKSKQLATNIYAPASTNGTQQAILAKLKNIYNTLTTLGYNYSDIFSSTSMKNTMMISYILNKNQ